MGYQALYRKWRPITFDDVVGQEHITTTLKNQVAAGKPSHAYLFTGSRGTGKTTCSKILAKAVNCPDQTQGNPCGVCDICTGIDGDRILDVTEIDAASNSGVDNIRELREEANFTPITTKYRVYIIDETHMLSTGAFNALLKIMEEPPPHVLFILATTEIHKVPATILSRCQRFDFQRIPSEIISQRLLYVAQEEKAHLDPDAALLIARLSDGGLRDALSLLDLCLSLDTTITYEMVQEAAGLTDQSYLGEMALAVGQEDYPKALTILQGLWEQSIDPQQFTQQLLGFYRNMLVVKSTTNPMNLVEGTPEELQRLKEVAEVYSLERIFYSMTSLSETLTKMSSTPHRRTELEIGLLKLSDLSMGTSPEALVARLEKLERQMKFRPVEAAVVEAEAPLPTKELEPSQEPEDMTPLSTIPVVPFPHWTEVLEVLGDTNRALYATLLQSSAYLSGDLLLVDAGSGLFAEMVRSDEYARESLRQAAFTVTGNRYRLGPYQPEQYEVTTAEHNLLDSILEAGQRLGVDIEINE